MARIAGIDLPRNKKIDIGLTYIYGIGRLLASVILENAQVSPDTHIKNLTDDEIARLNSTINKMDIKIEGTLRRLVTADIKRLQEINSYRGIRHRRNLPVRGQRTHTNARTKRGMRKTIGSVVKKK